MNEIVLAMLVVAGLGVLAALALLTFCELIAAAALAVRRKWRRGELSTRPADYPLLVELAAMFWLSTTLWAIDWALGADKPPEPPAEAAPAEPRGPNGLERSCQ